MKIKGMCSNFSLFEFLKEERFTFIRWNPVDGFSAKLLPTDRPNFSTPDGCYEKSKEKIKLPTMVRNTSILLCQSA